MFAKKETDNKPKTPPTTFGGALAYSFVIHLIVMTFAAVGLPHIAREPVTIAPPVTVELVDISEFTQTTKLSTPQKPQKDKKEEAKKTPQKKPSPPKVDSQTPPDLSQPKAPDLNKEDVAEPDPIPTPEALKKPIQKPAVPRKKPKPPKKKKVAPKKTNDFQSLLKNLTPDLDTEKQNSDSKEKQDSSEKSQIAKIAQKMTISEQDALRRQLAQCWNVMAGAKFAENIVVQIRIHMNPDRTIKQASIVDKGRYNRDSHFRASADAAVRALRDPRCTPLQLPPDKYETWKTITINFDPRDML